MGRTAGLLLVLALAGSAFPVRGAEPVPAAEDRLLASALTALADYVDWPPERKAEPLVIGVYGTCPVAGELQKLNRGRAVQGRAVQVVAYRNFFGLDQCDFLFICSDEMENLPELLKQVRGRRMLTVASVTGACEAGVMVGLIPDHGKHVIEINPGAIRKGGLALNARVLHYARKKETS